MTPAIEILESRDCPAPVQLSPQIGAPTGHLVALVDPDGSHHTIAVQVVDPATQAVIRTVPIADLTTLDHYFISQSLVDPRDISVGWHTLHVNHLVTSGDEFAIVGPDAATDYTAADAELAATYASWSAANLPTVPPPGGGEELPDLSWTPPQSPQAVVTPPAVAQATVPQQTPAVVPVLVQPVGLDLGAGLALASVLCNPAKGGV